MNGDARDARQDAISNSGSMTAMVRRVRLQPQKEEKTYPVLLRVKTSAMAGAGTSAAVFVSLYGTTGDALKQVRSTNTKPKPKPQPPTPNRNAQPVRAAAAAAAHAGRAAQVLAWQRRRVPHTQVRGRGGGGRVVVPACCLPL